MEDTKIRINLVLTEAAAAGILEELKNKKEAEARAETLDARSDTLSRQLEKL